MKILVIGRSGQLAQAIHATAHQEIILAGRPDVDLGQPETLRRAIRENDPEIVINAAAYTMVDRAETERDLAFSHNCDGPEVLAGACKHANIPLIHISTDCVFDGHQTAPYKRLDETGPLGVYGASKLSGEQSVRACWEKSLIFRVTWVFSEFGNNFVRTMLKLATSRDDAQVVSDQVGCPTYAPDIARALLQVSEQCLAPDFNQWGIYHLAGDTAIDRATMAKMIIAESEQLGGPTMRVHPVLTADYATPAQRPLNARLDSAETMQTFGIQITNWQSRLQHTVSELLKDM